MSATRKRIEEMFETALDMPREQRSAWLVTACSGNLELLGEVVALLEAHERADGILERNPVRIAEPNLIEADQGRRIGPYKIAHELGRGGMGVVYLAVREDGQFRQRVALKLLRGSPDADELYRRFLAERQILASLQHPNISQLLDGGVADGRLPYLVMEYVEGVPITEYCDRQRLPLTARLRLFLEVCDAVHHAHKNLVLHRDLKPGNILVTSTGQVKLLDFGIAKLLNPALSGIEQPITRADQRVLTPEYASPEQIRGDPLSTASDVYALGVVLYELIAGQPPYRLTTGSPQELTDLICVREPERPSTVVMRADATAAAAVRDLTVERWQRALRGDLDAITLMALRKEPARRYGSAELLAQDIARYLDGLPVLAQRGSRRYRLGKYLRRHRIQAVAAAFVLLSLLTGAGLTLWQASIARSERDRAAAALAETEQALAQSNQIAAFLTSLFEANDPTLALGGEVTARDLLQRGLRTVDRLDDQPLVQATMYDVLGRVQHSLGDYAEARRLFERSLDVRMDERGEQHPEVAATLYRLAGTQRYLGLFPEAESNARRALRIRESAATQNRAEITESLIQVSMLIVYRGNLAEADSFARRALQASRMAPASNASVRVRALIQQGSIDRRRGDDATSETNLRQAIALADSAFGPDHPDFIDPLLQLGYTLMDHPARLVEAESIFRTALDARRRTLGAEHYRLGHVFIDLGTTLQRQNRPQEALQYFRQGYTIQEHTLGLQHPMMVEAMGALGAALDRAGQAEEADSVLRAALALSERTYGPQHSNTAGAMRSLAHVLAHRRQFEEAERMMRRALAIRAGLGGPNTPLMGVMNGGLAEILIARRDFAQAELLLQQAATIFDSHRIPRTHTDYRDVLDQFVRLYEAWGKPESAEQYRRADR
jgi:serine/threonine-protein kinase